MIQSHPDAPDGIVKHLSSYEASDFTPGCAVLCRNIAPLVGLAYALLQLDVPCLILGRDIGAQLIGLVKKLRALNLEDLDTKLDKWAERESSKLAESGRSPERIYDQQECLKFFINGLDEDSRSIDDLIAKLTLMFSDNRLDAARKVTLCSIHKSKGLEFDKVFILDRPKLMPSRYAKQAWQLEQEDNLGYVATTRARSELYYINSNNWKDEQ